MCQLGHGDYRKLAQTSLKTSTKLFLGEADENMPDPQEFIHLAIKCPNLEVLEVGQPVFDRPDWVLKISKRIQNSKLKFLEIELGNEGSVIWNDHFTRWLGNRLERFIITCNHREDGGRSESEEAQARLNLRRQNDYPLKVDWNSMTSYLLSNSHLTYLQLEGALIKSAPLLKEKSDSQDKMPLSNLKGIELSSNQFGKGLFSQFQLSNNVKLKFTSLEDEEQKI